MTSEDRFLYESMTYLTFGPFSIRIWRDEDSDWKPIKESASEFYFHLNSDNCRAFNSKEIADFLVRLPRVSAVEVLFPDKGGVVVYKNWDKS